MEEVTREDIVMTVESDDLDEALARGAGYRTVRRARY
jgi:hypothetical protein